MGLTADIAQNHSRHLRQPPHRHPSAGARVEEEKSCRRACRGSSKRLGSVAAEERTVREPGLALASDDVRGFVTRAAGAGIV